MLSLLLFMSFVGVRLCCSPLPSTGQKDYCSADFVFEVYVMKNNTGVRDNKFEVTIKKIYKGADAIGQGRKRMIYGNGRFGPCGEHRLNKGEKYLIFANMQDRRIKIDNLGGYRRLETVDKDDQKRMTKLYDCSCEIKFIGWQSHLKPLPMPPPTRDECNMPEGACTTNVFCKKNRYTGRCEVGVSGKC